MCLSLLLPSLCVVSVISLVSVTNSVHWLAVTAGTVFTCPSLLHVTCACMLNVSLTELCFTFMGPPLPDVCVIKHNRVDPKAHADGVTITHTERIRSAIAAGFKTKSPKCLPQLCRHLLQKDQTSSLNNVKHSFLWTISRQSFGAPQSSKLSLVLARLGNFLNHSDHLSSPQFIYIYIYIYIRN